MKKHFFLLINLLFILNGVHAQVCLTGAVSYTAGATTNALCAADFNSDGRPDLAVANYGADNVSILLGSVSGTFGAATNFTVGNLPYGVVSADFNADTKLDLAVVNRGSSNVTILFGNGTGGFTTTVNYAVGTNPSFLTTGDFNADGKPDIATSNNSSNNVSVLIATGTGSFSPSVNYPAGSSPHSLICADFNSDGKLDLAVASQSANCASLLLGSSSGTFGAATTFTVGTTPRAITSGDFNGDGNADIALGNWNSNNVSVLLGTGTGSFGIVTNYTVGVNPYNMVNGDFDGNGKIDLVVANYNSSNISILSGNGTGGFGAAINFSIGVNPSGVFGADYNNDGKADLAVTNSSNNVIVLINNAPSLTVTSTSSLLCVGNISTLSAIGANTYTWNPGNGIGANYTISPGVNTVYTLTGASTLTGCSWTTSLTQSIAALPLVSVTIGTNSICAGQTSTIAATGANSYSWIPLNVIGSSVSINPTISTTYTVVGTNTITGCKNTNTITQNVFALPQITATTSSSLICLNQAVTLTANGANNYTWNPGGLIGASIAINPTSTTNYTVLGTNTLTGCANSNTISQTVSSLPFIVVSATQNTLCSGESSTLSVNGASTYTWFPGAIIGSSIIITPSASVNYSVIGSNSVGCTNTNLAVQSIVVHSLPTLSIIGQTLVCTGTTLTLSVSGASTYVWNTQSTNPTISVSPTVNSTYSVIGTDLYGCKNAQSHSVLVNALPVLTLSTIKSVICAGEQTTLSVSGASSYTWNGGQNSPSISIAPSITTTYSVIGKDLNGCNNSAIVTQTVSECTDVLSSGVSDNPMLNVFPNPNNGEFKISTLTDFAFLLINDLGEEIKMIELSAFNNYQINIIGLPSGCYTLIGSSPDNKVIKKIIVLK